MLVEAGSMQRPPDRGFSFSDKGVFKEVLMKKTVPAVVVPLQPFRTNERVTSQQGLFLCPNSHSRFPGFEIALKQTLASERERTRQLLTKELPSRSPEEPTPACLYKLLISPTVRSSVLKELHRMNINSATLFPGLDGFVRSLGTTLTFASELDGILWSGTFDPEI